MLPCASRATIQPRRPAHFILHTFRWKDEKREKRKYAKLLVICADPPEKDRWVQRIELLLRSHPESMHNKRFKVLVNPFSGSKTAVRIWQECEALFKLSGVKYDVTNTAYTRHAKEIASQIDLRQYHAIVTVSGDGLLHEVVNGLMERSDWQRALSLLLAAIPAGSGNGLARSVGTVDPVTTAFEILKGRRRKLDLMHVVQAKASAYAFLSVTWALIADIDLESEGYRWMGEPRFTVAALVRTPPATHPPAVAPCHSVCTHTHTHTHSERMHYYRIPHIGAPHRVSWRRRAPTRGGYRGSPPTSPPTLAPPVPPRPQPRLSPLPRRRPPPLSPLRSLLPPPSPPPLPPLPP